jgi:hypothetical protein
MEKTYKYSLVALRNSSEETYETLFEHHTVLKEQDNVMIDIGETPTTVQVAAVKRIDHIKTPNITFDYRLICIEIPI